MYAYVYTYDNIRMEQNLSTCKIKRYVYVCIYVYQDA